MKFKLKRKPLFIQAPSTERGNFTPNKLYRVKKKQPVKYSNDWEVVFYDNNKKSHHSTISQLKEYDWEVIDNIDLYIGVAFLVFVAVVGFGIKMLF